VLGKGQKLGAEQTTIIHSQAIPMVSTYPLKYLENYTIKSHHSELEQWILIQTAAKFSTMAYLPPKHSEDIFIPASSDSKYTIVDVTETGEGLSIVISIRGSSSFDDFMLNANHEPRLAPDV
jgi:hypothetical protein